MARTQETADQLLEIELARLDADLRRTEDVLRVAYGEGGLDPEDPLLVLRTLDRRARIGDRRAKLLGLGPEQMGTRSNPIHLARADIQQMSDTELLRLTGGG